MNEDTPLTDANAPSSTTDDGEHGLALLYLLKNLLSEDLHPMTYLKAAGEGLFVTLLLSWILTWIFNPDVPGNNPLLTRLGYNNLCVGWDTPPAQYLAAIMWITVAYLALRFTFTNHVRYMLSSRHIPYKSFGMAANVLFTLAVLAFVLCLMIPPTVSVWFHTLPFIGYIIGRYLIILALCLEVWSSLPVGTRVFCYVYGFISAALPIIYLSEYAYYEQYQEKSPWPWYVTFVLDYAWFACLALTSKLVPYHTVIRRRFDLDES